MAVEFIAHAYLSSDTSSIDFNNIPDTYRDLILVMSLRDVYTGNYTPEPVKLMLNNNNNNQLAGRWYGDNATGADGGGGNTGGGYAGYLCRKGAWDANFSCNVIFFPGANDGDGSGGTDNYTPAYLAWSGVMKASTTAGSKLGQFWGGKNETDRISRITISSNGGSNLEAKSTATLYGVTGS